MLDVGCGTGRHSIELTNRGNAITGIDLSDLMLGKAREKTEKQLLKIDFFKNGARDLPFKNEFVIDYNAEHGVLNDAFKEI